MDKKQVRIYAYIDDDTNKELSKKLKSYKLNRTDLATRAYYLFAENEEFRKIILNKIINYK